MRTVMGNMTQAPPPAPPTVCAVMEECRYLFHPSVTCCLDTFSEQGRGACVLLVALVLLITCLVFMVKVLKSLLGGSMAGVIQKTINSNFPGKLACLTGYVFILVGAILTVLVQSSSVVCSTLTPLVGLNLITIERIYPMLLGANVGTTSTAILAAFAAPADRFKYTFQIAMCHMFFNLTGIIIWYPLPFMRGFPIRLARFLGRTTSEYRWFAAVYIVGMFFLMPLGVFGLSMAGWPVMVAVLVPLALLAVLIIVLNQLQLRCPERLPPRLRSWDFLPEPLRTLRPYDRAVSRLRDCCAARCACCACCARDTAGVDCVSQGDGTYSTAAQLARAGKAGRAAPPVSSDPRGGLPGGLRAPLDHAPRGVIISPGGGSVTSHVYPTATSV